MERKFLKVILWPAIFSLIHISGMVFASEESDCGQALKELTAVAAAPAYAIPEEGKVITLDFWATWCPDCVDKLTHEVPAAYAKDPKALVLVNVDEDTKRAEVFLKRQKINLPVYREQNLKFKKLYKIVSVPHELKLKMTKQGCQKVN